MSQFVEAIVESAIADVMESTEPLIVEVAKVLELTELEMEAVRLVVRQACIDGIRRAIPMLQEAETYARNR